MPVDPFGSPDAFLLGASDAPLSTESSASGGKDNGPGGPSQNDEPSTGILGRLREFIANLGQHPDVEDRDSHSRFDRDPDHQRTHQVGSDTVYWDDRTGSYWFDSNGNGTVETEYWVLNGEVWYDLNNDGNPDSLLPPPSDTFP